MPLFYDPDDPAPESGDSDGDDNNQSSDDWGDTTDDGPEDDQS